VARAIPLPPPPVTAPIHPDFRETRVRKRFASLTEDLELRDWMSRLAPGVLQALRDLHPRGEVSGSRRRKHHQHLTRDYGHPAPKEHLSNVIFLMKGCATDAEFKRRLDMAAPKHGETPMLPFESLPAT
jgi:hypothetical protein